MSALAVAVLSRRARGEGLQTALRDGAGLQAHPISQLRRKSGLSASYQFMHSAANGCDTSNRPLVICAANVPKEPNLTVFCRAANGRFADWTS